MFYLTIVTVIVSQKFFHWPSKASHTVPGVLSPLGQELTKFQLNLWLGFNWEIILCVWEPVFPAWMFNVAPLDLSQEGGSGLGSGVGVGWLPLPELLELLSSRYSVCLPLLKVTVIVVPLLTLLPALMDCLITLSLLYLLLLKNLKIHIQRILQISLYFCQK